MRTLNSKLHNVDGSRFVIVMMTAVIAIVGGLATILGWLIEVPRLVDWLNDDIAMFANPALCVVLIGAACLLQLLKPTLHWIVRGLSATAMLIALLTLFEHATGFNIGIDTWITVREWGQNASLSPMRMGIPASTSIAMLGLAACFTTTNAKLRKVASHLAFGAMTICSVGLIGYWFGANPLFGIAAITAIARQTGILIFILGLSITTLVPEHGIHAAITRSDAGGTLLRRLLLPAVFVTLIVSWLQLQGINRYFFDAAFGTALLAIVEVVIFAALLMLAVRKVSKQSNLLHDAERRLSLIVGNSDDAILSIDLKGIIQSWNDGATRLFGYANAEIIGQSIHKLIPTNQHETESAIIDRILAGDKVAVREAQRLCKDGKTIDVSIATSPIINDVGRIIGVSKIVRDVTERKRGEDYLRQESKNKDEFLATLAHELRNPLSPIAGSLSLLSESQLPIDQQQLIEMADRHLKQMIRLIDDLLDVSRISRGKVVLQKSDCSLHKCVIQAVESVNAMCTELKHELRTEICDEEIFVRGDSTRLTQIITNILNNAAKYTAPGGSITLKLSTTANEAIIEVIDNGIGIPAEDHSKVFDLFTQLEHRDVSGKGGLGVGLALVKQLVGLHDGTVQLLSAGKNQGTRVVVQIPRIVAPMIQQAPALTADQHQNAECAVMTSYRVVVVDDMRANTFTMSSLLQKLGHTVKSANNGEQALAIIEDFKPQVVISDVSMPGMNGYELASQIRKSWGSSIRLVALTGYGTEADRTKAESHGFDTHMVKPPNIQNLRRFFEQLQFDESDEPRDLVAR
jgi:PAS domain S-box-containing protein